MAISTEQIKSLARLAKLSFSEEQLQSFGKEFEEIIAFADRINASVEGDTGSIREVENRFETIEQLRPDEVTESLSCEEITSNAVGKDGSFSVRRVVK